MTIPTPSYQSSKRVSYDTAGSGTPNAIFRKANNQIKRLVYTLVYKPGQLDTTRANQLISQFNTVKGTADSFSWTPWNGASAIDVKFASDRLDMSAASLVAYGTTIQLVKEPV